MSSLRSLSITIPVEHKSRTSNPTPDAPHPTKRKRLTALTWDVAVSVTSESDTDSEDNTDDDLYMCPHCGNWGDDEDECSACGELASEPSSKRCLCEPDYAEQCTDCANNFNETFSVPFKVTTLTLPSPIPSKKDPPTNLMRFRTILPWPGGKSRAVQKFATLWSELFPKATTAYSPFLGGGSFELVLASALETKVIANDCFCLLMDFWKSLKSNTHRTKMDKFVRANHPLSRTKYNAWVAMAKERSSFVKKYDLGTRGGMAYLITRASFSGRIAGGWSRSQASRRIQSPQDWYVRSDGAKMFGKMKFQCLDWSAFLKQHPTAGSATSPIYADPPYMLKERSRQQLYGFNNELHRDFDHIGLRKELGRRSHWMLCYNDTPEVKRLYAGYKFIQVKWSYSMQNKTQEGSGGTESREILIVNQGKKIAYKDPEATTKTKREQ